MSTSDKEDIKRTRRITGLKDHFAAICVFQFYSFTRNPHQSVYTVF